MACALPTRLGADHAPTTSYGRSNGPDDHAGRDDGNAARAESVPTPSTRADDVHSSATHGGGAEGRGSGPYLQYFADDYVQGIVVRPSLGRR